MRKAERSETGRAARGRNVVAAPETAAFSGRKPRASANGGPAVSQAASALSAVLQAALSQSVLSQTALPQCALSQSALSQPALSQRSVWYRLMKLTNLINRPFFSRYAERYHLTINDSRVLVTLASVPEAAAHELCEATGMHPMNVSRSVATLRRQGRIAERRDPANRRRKMLRLTPKGAAACRSFVPDMERMSNFLLASMSPLDVEFFGSLVDQLITRLETIDSRSGLPDEEPSSERAGRELDEAVPTDGFTSLGE